MSEGHPLILWMPMLSSLWKYYIALPILILFQYFFILVIKY